MRKFIAAVALAGACVAGSAQAQQPRSDLTQACGAEASRQRLDGQPLAEFLTACFAGRAALPGLEQRCDAEGRRRTLSGEALTAFRKLCTGGQVALPPPAGAAPPTCDSQGRRMGLAGEELATFIKRCSAG